MKLWPFFSVLLLVSQLPLLGQETASTRAEQKGHDALANGLWEVAELHFRTRLADPTLSPAAKSQVAMRLAESLVCSGSFDEALDLLGQSFVAKNPDFSFWKAQALTGKNRFKEAVEIFSTLLADAAAPYRTEAGFTRASLLLALDQPASALDTLTQLIQGADAATLVKIQLYQVEILLDLGGVESARKLMPKPENVTESDRALVGFLEAQLLLREEKFPEAEELFQTLVNQPDGQTLDHFHLAMVGLAEAIHAQGRSEIASQSLLIFLRDQPDSPALETIFKKLLQWLPEKVTATDPTMEQLSEWITPATLPALGAISNNSSVTGSEAVSAWPQEREKNDRSDLLIHSLYVRAIGLYRMATPDSQAEAKRLLNRLRIENPEDLLASRALYQLARWSLDMGANEQAFSMLDTLRETSNLPQLKGEAAFLAARASYLNGELKAAISLFNEAAAALAGPEARMAKLQAAVARIRSGNLAGIHLIQNANDTPEDKDLQADLALERVLSTTPQSAARFAIEEFLTLYPDHPRAFEARLAALEITLNEPSPNLAVAKSQFESLSEIVAKSAALPSPRLALVGLRLADLSKDFAVITAAAQGIMDTYPQDPAATEAALTLGRNLFQSGNYNQARLVLEKLAASDIDPTSAQPAWLLAARAAALGGTPQSKDEALILFDKAIQSGGPLSSVAALEKAAHLIEMYRLQEASEFLVKWIEQLPENDPLQLPAGLLLGETLYAQGSSRPASLLEALAVYDKLLTHAKIYPALFNRLQYLRGTTLEQLPDEKEPNKKREKQAFQAFHSVLETTTPPSEWEYFERCGFRGLALLEKAQRWPAAISVAKKIASFKGPRAEEAASRASQLQLKHMIFED